MHFSAAVARTNGVLVKACRFGALPRKFAKARVARLAAPCFIGSIQRKVPPNPSIERTRPGKPGRASHVKR